MSRFNTSILVFFVFFFTSKGSFAQFSKLELETFKQSLLKAIESSKVTDSLLQKLEHTPNKKPLLIGYMGTLQALKAKHSWNPYHKIKYVSRALKTMQNAINLEPENIEIRFMRFSIEHFTPSFLGFSKNLNEDRQEIVKQYQNNNFAEADELLIKSMAKFMIESKRCTPGEVGILKKKI